MAVLTAEEERQLESLTVEELDQLELIMDSHIVQSNKALEAFEAENDQAIKDGTIELNLVEAKSEEIERNAFQKMEEISRSQVLAGLR